MKVNGSSQMLEAYRNIMDDPTYGSDTGAESGHFDDYLDESGCIKFGDFNVTSLDDFGNSCTTCIELHELFPPSVMDNAGIQGLFAVLYVSVWLVGVAGNGLVLGVVAVSSYMRYRYGNTERLGKLNSAFPVRSVFVVSLACSDLLIAMTSLPVTAVNMFTQIWIFPDFMCYCIGFFQAFSIFQSSFTFTCIAVDRCLLITRPKRPLVTYRRARVIVLGTAILASVLASPMAFLMRMEELKPICGYFCVEAWSSSNGQAYYGLCVLLLQFASPAVVSAVCYSIIGVRLKKRQKNRFRRGSNGPPTPARWRSNERRIRTNRMMASMVAAFVLLWTPFNLMNLLRDLNLSMDIFQKKDRIRNSNYSLFYATAHLIAMASVVWNPIMYAWYNDSIRNVLRPVLYHCRPRIGRRMFSNYTVTQEEPEEEMMEQNCSIIAYTSTHRSARSDFF